MMEIYALANSGSIIKKLKCLNIQWTRRYYSCGEYSIQIPLSEFQGGIYWIYSRGREELGMVQQIQYVETKAGNLVQISGYFYEFSLTNEILYPRFYRSGKIGHIANEIVGSSNTENASKGIWTRTDVLGAEKSTTLYRILQTQEFSYKYKFSQETFSTSFIVWQGKDRTHNQNINTYANFSENLKNIENINYLQDNSNRKNYCIVAGGVGEETNIFEEVDQSNGDIKYKTYVDATEKIDVETQTLAEYKEVLRQQGLEELDKFRLIQTLTCDVVPANLKYMIDYDLGDKCDIVLDTLQISFSARIIEIYEVFKNNTHKIQLTFGEQIPTIYTKARL